MIMPGLFMYTFTIQHTRSRSNARVGAAFAGYLVTIVGAMIGPTPRARPSAAFPKTQRDRTFTQHTLTSHTHIRTGAHMPRPNFAAPPAFGADDDTAARRRWVVRAGAAVAERDHAEEACQQAGRRL
jgi:hypothetical protein